MIIKTQYFIEKVPKPSKEKNLHGLKFETITHLKKIKSNTMKKALILFATSIQLFLTVANAQQKDTIVNLPEITITKNVNVTKEVENAFNKTFPNAENVKWYTLQKDFLAKFMESDMKHNALFKKNGYLKYDIGFGKEENLPEYIQKMVVHAYEDYKILNTTNVKSAGRDIWVINLEGKTTYVIVRVEEDELEEVKRYTKAD